MTGDFGSAEGVVVVGVAGFNGVVDGTTGIGCATGFAVELVFDGVVACDGVVTGFFTVLFTTGVVGDMIAGFAVGTVGLEATVVAGFTKVGVVDTGVDVGFNVDETEVPGVDAVIGD